MSRKNEKKRVIVRASAGSISDAGPSYALITIGPDLARLLLERIGLLTALRRKHDVYGVEWEGRDPAWFNGLHGADEELADEVEEALNRCGYYVLSNDRQVLDSVTWEDVDLVKAKATLAGGVWWTGRWGDAQLHTTAIPERLLREIAACDMTRSRPAGERRVSFPIHSIQVIHYRSGMGVPDVRVTIRRCGDDGTLTKRFHDDPRTH